MKFESECVFIQKEKKIFNDSKFFGDTFRVSNLYTDYGNKGSMERKRLKSRRRVEISAQLFRTSHINITEPEEGFGFFHPPVFPGIVADHTFFQLTLQRL